MKLLVDMNMSTKWRLSLLPPASIHWSQLSSADAPDDDIVAHAAATDAVVLTRDLDFSAILAANRLAKPSVVHLREEDRFQPDVVERVVRALRMFENDLAAGAIISMSSTRLRIRRLPIGGAASEADPGS